MYSIRLLFFFDLYCFLKFTFFKLNSTFPGAFSPVSFSLAFQRFQSSSCNAEVNLNAKQEIQYISVKFRTIEYFLKIHVNFSFIDLLDNAKNV